MSSMKKASGELRPSYGLKELLSKMTPELKEEMEFNQRRVAQLLKERCSHIPFYAERAAKDPKYWMKSALRGLALQ